MRPAAHRYHPDLHPTRRLPAFRVVRSHRRPRAGWPPWVGAAFMVFLGSLIVVLTLAASRGPTVGPVHIGRPPVAAVPLVPQEVASDPPVDQRDGQGQDSPPAHHATSTNVTTEPLDDPAFGPPPTGQTPTAPAANSPAQAAPTSLSLPELSSPPPMAVPSPSPSPGPGCGRKPSPHPTRSPRVQAVRSAHMLSSHLVIRSNT